LRLRLHYKAARAGGVSLDHGINMSDGNRVLLEEIRDLLKQQNSLIASIAETNRRVQEDNAKSFIATDNHLKRSEKLKAAEVRNNLVFLCFVIIIILFTFIGPKLF
jgi:t-SNARE complex subunit (syntaxin)